MDIGATWYVLSPKNLWADGVNVRSAVADKL